MRPTVVFILSIITFTLPGCGYFGSYSQYSGEPAAADTDTGAVYGRRKWSASPRPRRPTPRCTDRAGTVALRHGDRVLPLRASEAASVAAMVRHWYWSELRTFAKRNEALATELAAMSPADLSVSISNGTATFFLDGYRPGAGGLTPSSRLRNGKPDRGEASLVDVTGASNVRVPLPDLGTFGGRSLDLTGSRSRCVPERSPTDDAAVSAALAALTTATHD
jgi:hypothetical protein